MELDRTKLYGVTHSPDGTPLTREVRILKVGIGYPKGPAVHVYIDRAQKWVVEVGVGKDAKRLRFDSRPEAEKAYNEQRRKAPLRGHPGKFPYFTFHRIGIDGSYYPDWEAIERHGPVPTEIGIVFLTDQPLELAYQWWTVAELKCEGDGINARRRITAAQNEEERRLAAEAEAAGEQFFPLVGKCYTKGCPLARGEKRVCKPHSRLSFQLAYAPMLGGTCTFDSTGFRSAADLASSIHRIRTVTGRGNAEQGTVAGIPLLLTLRPYRASHQGKPTTQYAVSLQLRASDAVELYRKAIEAGEEFRRVALASAPERAAQLPEAQEAARMEAEFYPENEEPEEDTDWQAEPDSNEIAMPRRKSETATEAPGESSEGFQLEPEVKHETAD